MIFSIIFIIILILMLVDYLLALVLQLVLFFELKKKNPALYDQIGKPTYIWINTAGDGKEAWDFVWRTKKYHLEGGKVYHICLGLRICMISFLIFFSMLVLSAIIMVIFLRNER